MGLMDVNTRRLSELKYKLLCSSRLAADIVGVALWSLCMMRMGQHS